MSFDELPFCIAIETGPSAGSWRLLVQLSDSSDCRLSPDESMQLASYIRDAIEHRKNRAKPVRNDAGQEIVVRRFENIVTVDFRSPQSPTNSFRLSVNQGKFYPRVGRVRGGRSRRVLTSSPLRPVIPRVSMMRGIFYATINHCTLYFSRRAVVIRQIAGVVRTLRNLEGRHQTLRANLSRPEEQKPRLEEHRIQRSQG